MLRSLFASISGLRAHQTMMDVTANNIANVNTQGFKASRAIFADALAQTVRGGGIPRDGGGTTNPMQIGLGSRVAAVNTTFAQGSLQLTGRLTDLAVQGDGFFVVRRGDQELLTRDGAFNWDATGKLVTTGGATVLGWQIGADGKVNTTEVPDALTIPTGTLPPVPTSAVTIGGNIKASADVGDTVVTTATIYNSLGESFALKVTATKTAVGDWDLQFVATDGEGTATDITPAGASVSFDVDGKVTTSPPEIEITGVTLGNGDAQDILVRLGTTQHGLTQYDQTATMNFTEHDGAAGAELYQVNFGTDGSITAQYTNGDSRQIGMVAVATVTNPEGMLKMADNLFATTLTSGDAVVGLAGEGQNGTIAPGSLEGSNVDLATEFTNLVLAQRGFQANTRVITTSDEMLADLVNVKR